MDSIQPDNNYVLHLGVIPQDLQRVIRSARAVMDSYEVAGDGWNAWGEAVNTDVNDDVTLHLTAAINGRQEAVEDTAAELVSRLDARGALVTSSEGRNTVAALTPDDDYSVEEAGGVVWERESGALTRRTIGPPSSTSHPTAFTGGVLAHSMDRLQDPGTNGLEL